MLLQTFKKIFNMGKNYKELKFNIFLIVNTNIKNLTTS